MDFRVNNPGAVKYGNFINYYQFNSAEERLNLLPASIWNETSNNNKSSAYIVLDIGCNSGVLTELLQNFLTKQLNRRVIILGVDIDPILIQRACELANDNITFECLDIMNSDSDKIIQNFLNLHNKQKFDALFCFSITMWIHLNYDDEGLKEFLKKCSRITEILVIEPQPWKCYQTAVKRLKKANEIFSNYQKLVWRQNVESEIENYLENSCDRVKIHETIPTKWKRKICFYRNKTNS